MFIYDKRKKLPDPPEVAATVPTVTKAFMDVRPGARGATRAMPPSQRSTRELRGAGASVPGVASSRDWPLEAGLRCARTSRKYIIH